MSDKEPITLLYQFLWKHQDKITDTNTLYDVKAFRDFCLIKSMPRDLHASYVAAFRKRSEKLGSQTENKELIALQLAAAALEIIPFEESNGSSSRLGPSFGMAYALELRSSDWTQPFSERTCDHIFTWGEPPITGALDNNQQLKDFVDTLIQKGIMNDTRLKDDLETRTRFVGSWLREEKDIDKYYVAILPERNSNLIDALLENENLGDLIVVSCPEESSADLALIKTRIDEVSRILTKLYQKLNQ
ncbi:MAG: hypothetical protein ACK449_07070 [Planctomycetota bacterium]|jgi:hypothetical protein